MSFINVTMSDVIDRSGREINVSTPFGGGGTKSGNTKSQTATYQTFVCTICKNEQENDSSTPYNPITIKSSEEDIS